MAYDYISRGKAKENGYTNTRVFRLFGVSSTGYYNYVARREDRDGKQAARKQDERHVMQCFKKIIKTLDSFLESEPSVDICSEGSIIISAYQELQPS